MSPADPQDDDIAETKLLYFDGVFGAMSSLLLHGSLPDLADFVYSTTAMSTFCGFLLVVFIFLAPLTLMVMLLGVLVEVVGVVASVERETIAVDNVKNELRSMLSLTDDELHEDKIDRQDFRGLMMQEENASIITALGVDATALLEFIDFEFADRGCISFVALFDLVLQLRGHQQVTVKDVVDLRKFLKQEVGEAIISEIHKIRKSLKANSKGSKSVDPEKCSENQPRRRPGRTNKKS